MNMRPVPSLVRRGNAWFYGCCLACHVLVALPGVARAQSFPEGVIVDDHGDSVTLRNSEINLTMNKGDVTVTSIYKRGGGQSVNLLSGGRGYYWLNYVIGSNRRIFSPQSSGYNMVYELIHSDSDRAEISLSFNNRSKLPFRFEYRIILFANVPGFYMYSIFRYPEEMPNGAALEQSRYSFRAKHRVNPGNCLSRRIFHRPPGTSISRWRAPWRGAAP